MATEPDKWQKVFVTEVIGPADLPDVTIITLPRPQSPEFLDLKSLNEFVLASRDGAAGLTFNGGSEIFTGAEEIRRALVEVISDAATRQNLPWVPDRLTKYANEIFYQYEVPVENSPLSGLSLSELAKAGPGAVAFAALIATGQLDLTHVLLYFAMVGGTPVMVGAGNVFQSIMPNLKPLLLKWMAVPTERSQPIKRSTGDSNEGVI